MGSMSLEGMREAGKGMGFSEDTVLSWHLSGNCYPPITEFFDVAKAAIIAARDGDWDATINIAEIMGNDKYNTAAPVWKIIEGWHLESFIESEEDY